MRVCEEQVNIPLNASCLLRGRGEGPGDVLSQPLPPGWDVPGATGPFLLSPGRPEVEAEEPQSCSQQTPRRQPEQKASLPPGTASGRAVAVCGGVLRLGPYKEGKRTCVRGSLLDPGAGIHLPPAPLQPIPTLFTQHLLCAITGCIPYFEAL